MAIESGLERRVARLEALLAVLLVEPGGDRPALEEMFYFLRHREREPDFEFWDRLQYLVRHADFRSQELREHVREISERCNMMESSSKKMSDEITKIRDQIEPLYKSQDTFERTFRKSLPNLERSIRPLESALAKLSDDHRAVQIELHSFLVARSLSIDPDLFPLHRFVPVRVYLPQDNPSLVSNISSALTRLLDAFGFSISDEFPVERSSWFASWFAKS